MRIQLKHLDNDLFDVCELLIEVKLALLDDLAQLLFGGGAVVHLEASAFLRLQQPLWEDLARVQLYILLIETVVVMVRLDVDDGCAVDEICTRQVDCPIFDFVKLRETQPNRIVAVRTSRGEHASLFTLELGRRYLGLA